MTEIRYTIQWCDQCPFADTYIPWCYRYRRKLTLHNISEEKPKWCEVKEVIVKED